MLCGDSAALHQAAVAATVVMHEVMLHCAEVHEALPTG